MGVDRGSGHRRAASLAGQPGAQDFSAPSASDDRASFLPKSQSQAPLQAQQRNAHSGPHALQKQQETWPSSPPVETAPGPRLLPPRQHYRPEESPEDVSSLAELNPSIVTLVPHFSFSPQRPAKEKPKKKASREAAADRKQTAAAITANVARAADVTRSPPPQGTCQSEVPPRDDEPWESKKPLWEDQGFLSLNATDVLRNKTGPTATAPTGEGCVDVSIDEPVDGGSVGRKRGPARPRSVLRPLASKLQPLPFQNVFGMSVDEELDTAPARRELRTADMASPGRARWHLDAARQPSKRAPSAQDICKLSTKTPASAEFTRGATASAEVAVEGDAWSMEKSSTKPLPTLRSGALGALNQTSNLGRGGLVVEEFLSNLHAEQGIF